MGKRGQQGQAIVLLALMMLVLVGMVGLGLDSGRAYVDRRELQDAVDAAALAAADTYQANGGYGTAWSLGEQAALSLYAANERIYSTASCSPALGVPTTSPQTWTCSYPSDSSHSVTLTITNRGASGAIFQVSATHQLRLALMQLLSASSTISVGATATSNVSSQTRTPAIATLSQNGCNGNNGHSLSISGGGNITVNGDMISSGDINIQSANSTVKIAGDVLDQCPNPPPTAIQYLCYPSGASPPCTLPDVVGAGTGGQTAFPDPGYQAPSLSGLTNQANLGAAVVIAPGIYSTDPHLTNNAGCYFMAAGVYDWQNGFTANGGFISNELKPPDEPVYTDNTQRASSQFWDSNSSCAGSFSLVAAAAPPGHNIAVGAYALEVTTTRTDTYNGVSYSRESAPSMCRTVSTTSLLGGIQVTINNPPGAQGYNVYVSTSGCGGPFGYVYHMTYTGVQLQTALGVATTILDDRQIPVGWTPNAGASPGTSGAYPPSGETAGYGSGLPQNNPGRAASPNGDRANENYCADETGTWVTCPARVTPGAVIWYIPSTGCLSLAAGGDYYFFSGYQYNWISLWEPGAFSPPANTCNNTIAGHSNTAMIGTMYMPSANVSITGGSTVQAPIAGGIVANTATLGGSGGITIQHSDAVDPSPPSARLIY